MGDNLVGELRYKRVGEFCKSGFRFFKYDCFERC